MKIRISNTAPFWKLLLLLIWLFIVGACIGHSLSYFFHLGTLRLVSVQAYIVVLVLILMFNFFTAIYLAKGLLTWLDK